MNRVCNFEESVLRAPQGGRRTPRDPDAEYIVCVCIIKESALHAPQAGRRIPRDAGAEYTVLYQRICIAGTAGRPRETTLLAQLQNMSCLSFRIYN